MLAYRLGLPLAIGVIALIVAGCAQTPPVSTPVLTNTPSVDTQASTPKESPQVRAACDRLVDLGVSLVATVTSTEYVEHIVRLFAECARSPLVSPQTVEGCKRMGQLILDVQAQVVAVEETGAELKAIRDLVKDDPALYLAVTKPLAYLTDPSGVDLTGADAVYLANRCGTINSLTTFVR